MRRPDELLDGAAGALSDGLAAGMTRRSFLGRVGAFALSVVGGSAAAAAVAPEEAEAHHFCGHILVDRPRRVTVRLAGIVEREEEAVYARMTTLRGSPDASQEAVEQGLRVLKEQVIPAAEQLRGYKGVISVGDRTTGKGITLTLWESEDAMRESEEAAGRLREQAAQAMSEAVESVERYEVFVCDVRETAR